MKRIVTFGEIMLRLNPAEYKRFLQVDSFNASYAGSEASVAVSLALLDCPVSFVSKLPENEIGQAALNELRKYGVDTSCIIRSNDRMGIYFVEKGASQRPSKVIYDRKNSAFANLKKADLNWEAIFKDACWFHFSGITPALSDDLEIITLLACKKAKEMGLVVSCDLNYRNKLWTSEKAKEVMTPIMQYVDHCIGNEEDIQKVFGIGLDNGRDKTVKELSIDFYKDIALKLKEKFSLQSVSLTLRESYSANSNDWSGMICTDNEIHFSDKYNINIVDRLGGGDSFCAGLIYALINNYSKLDSINFAVASSCLKHSIENDYNLSTKDEILALMSGNKNGRIQR